MDALHEARIKVLRDRQELKLSEAIERMERELDTLREHNIKSVKSLQIEHRNEETALIKALDSKKTALRHRWHLEEAILRRQLEQRSGNLYGPLPPISFNVSIPETGETGPEAQPEPEPETGTETEAETEIRDSAICVSEGSPVTGQK